MGKKNPQLPERREESAGPVALQVSTANVVRGHSVRSRVRRAAQQTSTSPPQLYRVNVSTWAWYL